MKGLQENESDGLVLLGPLVMSSGAFRLIRIGDKPPGRCPLQFLRFFLVCVLVILSSLLVLLSNGELSAKPQDSAGQAQEAPERGSLVHRRERWFYDQRRFPLGYIHAGARPISFRQLKDMVCHI